VPFNPSPIDNTPTQPHPKTRSFDSRLEEALFAIELIESEGGLDGSNSSGSSSSSSEAAGLLQEALGSLAALDAALERWELRRLLSGQHDVRGAVLTVQAGAGGVDAMDWAEMLERM